MWTLNIKEIMKEFKLQDFYTDEEIQVLKDKIKSFPKKKQLLSMSVLGSQIDQIIRERFPEMPIDVTYSTRILHQEFAFVYQK